MSSITTLFLDLDDTLYPNSSGIWQMIRKRIQLFLLEKLNITPDEAAALRIEYLEKYGTTLNGLVRHHQIEAEEYLSFVHDVPVEEQLPPNPALQEMLSDIHLKRVIFTNSSSEHAERVIQRLGIHEQIDQVIDIRALEFVNKPEPGAYQRALALAGEPESTNAMLVDDRIENIRTAASLGMKTVFVGEILNDPAVDFQIIQITDLLSAVPELASDGTDLMA